MPAGDEFTDGVVEAWKKLSPNTLSKKGDWAKRVGQWLAVGVDVELSNANEVLLKKSGDNIGKIANGVLLSTKKPANFKDYTPVGNAANGCQMYAKGANVYVKRVPNTNGLSPDEINLLTSHSNAHVLERHNFDVTDEALELRAKTGIAPDGHTVPQPPDYSSKFENTHKLKAVLNNTKPGTSSFNNTPAESDGSKIVILEATSGYWGYGIPSGGNIGGKIYMAKVKAIYAIQGGAYKLVTMYPTP